MKMKESECDCNHPEILKEHPKGCTLNQIIKCHGDQPFSELVKHIDFKLEEE